MDKQPVTAIPPHIRQLVAERETHRARREWDQADAIRERIEAEGFLVEDGSEGPMLYRREPPAPVRVRRPAEVPDRLAEDPSAEFSLVFVAQDNWEEIERGVRAALQWAGSHRLHVVLVENGSTDETRPSVLAWAERDPRIEAVLVEEPLGEAAARNCGFRLCRGEIIVSHGNSVEISGDVYAPLKEALGQQRVGLVGRWGVVTESMFEFEPAPGQEADAVEAYFMATRREVLREVGLWDEKFRFYRMLDLDWSFQVRRAGYEVRLLPELPLRQHAHRLWESLSEEERQRLSRKNFFRFLDKWRHEEGFQLLCGRTPHELAHARRPGSP